MTRTTMILSTLMLGWMNIPAQAELLSGASENLWPVLSQQFTISNEVGKMDVQKQINIDLQHPKYIHRLTENARPYLYDVFQETQRKHLPAELALLPMIESDYMPSGASRTGATGLWQLMPDTAAGYGIKMNTFYDGRRNTTVSTKAALNFLSYLYDLFGHNWLLALAAYNAGPGTVMNAIHYNKAHGLPTDFWALHLPQETKVYVPKLLALAAIIQDPHGYGMHLAPVPNKPIATTVVIKNQMPISKIATMAHTSVSTVKTLNPALRKSVTPPHQTLTLMLPINNKHVFEKQLKAEKRESSKAVTVANKHDKKNNVHEHHKHVHTAKHEQHKNTHVASTHNEKSYHVAHGDSLRTIAERHHTTIKALMRKNHLSKSALQVGQRISV